MMVARNIMGDALAQISLDRLLSVTSECREDMREPDEQGIEAVISGYHLDNAMGNHPAGNAGVYTVGIRVDGGEYEWFNLATLIALARKAK